MKKLILLLVLLMTSNVLAVRAMITLRNPCNYGVTVDFVKGHMFNSNQLGSNTQNVLVDENRRIYIPAGASSTFYIKMRCYESYRPVPPPRTPIHPTPFHMPREDLENPSGSIDADIKRAKRKAKKVQGSRDREQVIK